MLEIGNSGMGFFFRVWDFDFGFCGLEFWRLVIRVCGFLFWICSL